MLYLHLLKTRKALQSNFALGLLSPKSGPDFHIYNIEIAKTSSW